MNRTRSRIQAGVDRIGIARSRSRLLALVPTGARCAEVGVWKGDFSQRILHAVHPVELHLIDPWHAVQAEGYEDAWYGGRLEQGQLEMDAVHEGVLDRFAAARAQGIVHVHRLSSAEAAPRFADGHFDFVYIDGNHYEEYVRRDLAAWAPKLREGGIIGGDDYGLEGWWHNGVTRAVDEFVRSGGADLVMIDRTQFALRVTNG